MADRRRIDVTIVMSPSDSMVPGRWITDPLVPSQVPGSLLPGRDPHLVPEVAVELPEH